MNGQDYSERELSERLAALKDALRLEQAPERVESVLIVEFRRGSTQPPAAWWRRWEFAAVAATVALAAIGATAVTLGVFPGRKQEQPAVAEVAPLPAVVDSPLAAAVPDAPAAPDKPLAARLASTVPATQEAGPFIPLLPDLTWMPGEQAQVLRVSMPRSALQSLGLPVDENRAFETVRADLVVGQDMVARAIRLVR